MAVPTIEELTQALAEYVDASADDEYVQSCVRDAVAFIEKRVPSDVSYTIVDNIVTAATVSPLGDEIYKREAIELGSELYYRRSARNGVVSVNTIDGSPIRISADPFKAAAQRLARHVPWGFA